MLRRMLHAVASLPAAAVILVVRIYQWTLSPLLGDRCRFQPTCSRYMIGAVQKYGFLVGTAIPEPSSAVLVAAFGAVFLTHRRRSE